MKKLLGILVLGLLWCNVGVSGENKFTAGAININLPNEYEFKKIGTNAGDAHVSSPYRNVFYAQVKEGKLVGLLEIFNYGFPAGRGIDYAKSVLFKSDPNGGCNESSTNQYFQVLNKGGSRINCVSVQRCSRVNAKRFWSKHF